MSVCWVCSHPSPGLSRAGERPPVGFCQSCGTLACDEHGAVEPGTEWFCCSACQPWVGLQRDGSAPAADRPDGPDQAAADPVSAAGPASERLLGGPAQSPSALAFRFPRQVAASRAHAAAVVPYAPLVLHVARCRWRHLAGEELRAPVDLVPTLVGLSLWSAGHRAGDLPTYAPGTEGPQLRRSPLVAGLLYLWRIELTAPLLHGGPERAEPLARQWSEPRGWQTSSAVLADAQTQDELQHELARLQAAG